MANDSRKRFFLRYGFAVVGSGVGVALSALLTPHEAPIYALLVGVVAIAIWYGGLGPGLTAVAVGWALELLVLAEEDGVRGLELTRWAVTLAIALSVIWVSIVLRLRSERATSAASEVEASFRDMARLQELSATLSAAVTPSDVAQGLVARTPSLIGARGAALGLIEGSDLVIVDPRVAGSTHEPGFRLPLSTRAPIAQAANEGRTIVVDDRRSFERDFPDGAALTLYAHRAIAVPLLVAGEPVGALSLLFDESGTTRPDAEEIAEFGCGARWPGTRACAPVRAGARIPRWPRPNPAGCSELSRGRRRERDGGDLRRSCCDVRRGHGDPLAPSRSAPRARVTPRPTSWHLASKLHSPTSPRCAMQWKTAACRSWPTCRTRPEEKASKGYGPWAFARRSGCRSRSERARRSSSSSSRGRRRSRSRIRRPSCS